MKTGLSLTLFVTSFFGFDAEELVINQEFVKHDELIDTGLEAKVIEWKYNMEFSGFLDPYRSCAEVRSIHLVCTQQGTFREKDCSSFGFCQNEGWGRALPKYFVTFL